MDTRMLFGLGAAAMMTVLPACAASVQADGGETAAAVAPSQLDAAPASAPSPKPSPQPPAPSEVTPSPYPELRELTVVRSSRTDTPETVTVEAAEIPAEPTKILDPTMAERLFGNTGVTLQWISWEERGPTWVAVDENGYWMLLGGQEGTDGGNLDIEGFITEIGPDYFLYDGTIKITGTPDEERRCNVSKRGWRFAITQNRKYWRLRDFNWCDGLTDYVDIYF
ncbi:hypothetical protein [Erythrobacter sp. YT30]|uniref:hypothetical protein n=1 Tax=Erythrobacter sp. YT30 TaxID=1735012 RepID=UPI000B0C806B|nr:hypothetical protein [Erythrobacter sp. YT30]